MTKKTIFISYDYDNDRNHKNMLLAWDKNKIFDFNIKDKSADVSINSHDAGVIKRAISAKISQADVFLCLVGENTHKSDWVKWEIDKAKELDKKIVSVKIEKHYKTLDELFNAGAKWSMSFTFDAIKTAIEECTTITIYKGVKKEPEQINHPSKPWNVG